MKTGATVVLAGVLMFALPSSAAGNKSSPSPRATSSFAQLSEAAGRAREANREDEAIQLYQTALALKPDWQEGLWYLGSLMYEKEQYAGARDVLRRFVGNATETGPSWALLGMSEFQTREYGRALDHLQRALALGMGERKEMIQSVSYFVAILLTRVERYDDSLNFIFRLIASGQEKDLLIEPIGLAALRFPVLPAEIPANLRELVRMAGEAAFLSQTPEHANADKIFKAMVSAYPNEAGVHFLYGVYLLDFSPEAGSRELQKELEISPSHVVARLRLSSFYLQNQKIDEALELANQAVKLDPHYPSAHMMLGEVEVAKGDISAGIKELEVARDAEPMILRVHWDLLRAYTAAGRPEEAKREKAQIEALSRSGSDSGREAKDATR